MNPSALISQKVLIKSLKVLIKSFYSQCPHKSVNLSFIITNVKNKATDLCENWLLQNDCTNTFCEIGAAAILNGSGSSNI